LQFRECFEQLESTRALQSGAGEKGFEFAKDSAPSFAHAVIVDGRFKKPEGLEPEKAEFADPFGTLRLGFQKGQALFGDSLGSGRKHRDGFGRDLLQCLEFLGIDSALVDGEERMNLAGEVAESEREIAGCDPMPRTALKGDIPPQMDEVFEFVDPFDHPAGADRQIRERSAEGSAAASRPGVAIQLTPDRFNHLAKAW